MMIIKISSLSEGVHSFEFSEPVEKIGLNEEFKGDIKVNAALTKSSSQLILDAELEVPAKFECDRCLGDFETVLSNKYRMVYLFGAAPEDNDDISITYLPLDADKIDITEDVKDYAFLSIPMKNLCDENCKGLCQKCGKNLNEGECGCEKTTDPRWQPLLNIKKNLDNN